MPHPSEPKVHAALAARLLQRLGLAVLVSALLVALFELVAPRIPALAARMVDPEREALAKSLVVPHPFLAYVPRPGVMRDERASGGKQVSHNAAGFRGPEMALEKPAGVFRIACLGGSSTYGHGPSCDDATWPARLQARLNQRLQEASAHVRVEVQNAGCPGYSTFESSINLGLRVVDYAPDLVLVYHAINDMRYALWHEAKRDDTNWRAIWPVERPHALQRLLDRSATYRLLRNLDPDWVARRSGDLGWYAIVDYNSEAWSMGPAAEVGFQSIRRNLENILGLAQVHGAHLMLGLQAVRWSDLDRFGTAAAQREGLRRVLDLVRDFAHDHALPLADCARAVESAADRQRAELGQDSLFTSEVHLTDAGADLVAACFCDAILAQAWLP